jgi:uncharacterized membrane protein (DUF373 family)
VTSSRSDRKAEPPALARLGSKALSLTEDVIYVSIAVLLAAGAAVLLVRAAFSLVGGAQDRASDSLIETLDAILLVFIFVELLYAVRITLKERQIVAEPFLLAGILVCIKEIIVLSVAAPTEYIDEGPQFARAMVEIGLLGGLILALAGTAVLLRKKENEPQENSGTDDGQV